jgi:hypothetical protein
LNVSALKQIEKIEITTAIIDRIPGSIPIRLIFFFIEVVCRNPR